MQTQPCRLLRCQLLPGGWPFRRWSRDLLCRRPGSLLGRGSAGFPRGRPVRLRAGAPFCRGGPRLRFGGRLACGLRGLLGHGHPKIRVPNTVQMGAIGKTSNCNIWLAVAGGVCAHPMRLARRILAALEHRVATPNTAVTGGARLERPSNATRAHPVMTCPRTRSERHPGCGAAPFPAAATVPFPRPSEAFPQPATQDARRASPAANSEQPRPSDAPQRAP